MKMSKVLGVALFALLIASVVAVAPAAAAEVCSKVAAGTGLFETSACSVEVAKGNFELFTILLALWLVNGAEVTTELTTETSGELEMTDNKTLVGSVTILCSGVLDGWIGPNSLDWVSEVLNIAKEKIGTLVSGPGLTCTAVKGCETNTAPLVYPLDLPWESEVELYQGGTLTLFFVLLFGTSGTPGWEVVCLVAGLSITDECKPENIGEAAAELTLEGTIQLSNFSEAATEAAGAKLANCSQGGKESGELFSTTGTIKLNEGGELTASSESSVS